MPLRCAKEDAMSAGMSEVLQGALDLIPLIPDSAKSFRRQAALFCAAG